MRVPKKQGPRTDWPKLQKRGDRPPVTANKRLADQTRKILGKHYASKYRVR
jgi:hypothetical protein